MVKPKKKTVLLAFLLSCVTSTSAHAGFFDDLKEAGQQARDLGKKVVKETGKVLKDIQEPNQRHSTSINQPQSNTTKKTRVTKDPTVVRIQECLNRSGHNAGPADGLIGAKTRLAIRDFERSNNLPETGEPTENIMTSICKLAKKTPSNPVQQSGAVAPEIASAAPTITEDYSSITNTPYNLAIVGKDKETNIVASNPPESINRPVDRYDARRIDVCIAEAAKNNDIYELPFRGNTEFQVIDFGHLEKFKGKTLQKSSRPLPTPSTRGKLVSGPQAVTAFKLPTGSDIYAMRDGIHSGTDNRNWLHMKNQDGTTDMYAFLAPGSITISKGEKIKKGQKLAEVGAIPQIRLSFKGGKYPIATCKLFRTASNDVEPLRENATYSYAPQSNPEFSRKYYERKCDLQAESPEDPHRRSDGIPLKYLNTKIAQKACNEAINSGADNARIKYQYGRSFHAESNVEQAKKWYLKAIKDGSVIANVGLGDLLLDTEPEKAAKHFETAATQCSPAGAYRMASLFQSGQGVPAQSSILAQTWHNLAETLGHRLPKPKTSGATDATKRFEKMGVNSTAVNMMKANGAFAEMMEAKMREQGKLEGGSGFDPNELKKRLKAVENLACWKNG